MRKLVLFVLVILATSCTYSHRGPASADIEIEEFDQYFSSIEDLDLKQIAGTVFHCESITRKEGIDSDPKFSMVGMLPLGVSQVVFTIGDGTNKGTRDTLAKIESGQIVWKYEGGELRLRHDQEHERLLINSVIEIENVEVIVTSHVCTVGKR